MTESIVPQFEKDLLFALRETLIKQRKELTRDNYVILVKQALFSILKSNDYRDITRNNEARTRLLKYNRAKVLTYLCVKLADYYNIPRNMDIVNRIKDSYIEPLLKYANAIFPNLITEEYLKPSKLSYDDSIEKGISDVKFYAPTNKCRDAVMSGKQVLLSSSSAYVSMMNAYSNVGKVRTNQEDSYYIGIHPQNKEFKIMLVADGMGGHNNGELASNYTTRELIKWFESLSPNEYYRDNQDLIESLKERINNIDLTLKEKYPGAGTTLCICIVKNNELLIGNIGDSKGFVLEDSKMVYTTTPDNVPNALNVPDPFDRFFEMSNAITNSIGAIEDPKLRYKVIELKPNTKYSVVLCSDGVSDLLSNKEISDIIVKCKDFNELSKELVDIALNGRSSFQDYYKQYFGTIAGREKYNLLYNLLSNFDMDQYYESVINGGKDNTTAVAGQILR